MGDFSEGVVPQVELEGVPQNLLSVFVEPDLIGAGGNHVHLDVPLLMVRAEHVDDEEIHVTISIDVGEVRTHGEGAGAAQGELREGLKEASALIDPDSVWRVEIVADVDVGCAVAGEVSHLDGQSPVTGRILQWPSGFIAESSGGERQFCKTALTIIEE